MGNLNNEKITRKLITINKGFDRAIFQSTQAKEGILDNDITSYEENVIEALLTSEKQYIELKKLAALTISNKLMIREVEQREKAIANIEIKQLKNNVICLTVPIITPFSVYHTLQLFPKSIEKNYVVKAIEKSTTQLYLIQQELYKFFTENKIDSSIYKNMTVLYINHFADKYDNNRIPDTNNYTYKSITDVICSILRCDEPDSIVDTLIQTRNGKETFTEIYVLPFQYDLKKTALELQKR